jgi:hypothetical protein
MSEGGNRNKSLTINWGTEDYHYDYRFSAQHFGSLGKCKFWKWENVNGNDEMLLIPEPNELCKFYPYTDFSIDALEKSYLYFASPSLFNDPFDCLWHRSGYYEKNLDIDFTGRHTNIGVCSFTTVRDNLLMWGHYTDSYKGFGIKFKNKNFMNYSKSINIKMPVSYIKDFHYEHPNLTEAINGVLRQGLQLDIAFGIRRLFRYIYEYGCKTYDWRHENEYRMISLEASDCEYKVNFDPKCLEEIYIGYKMEIAKREFLISIIKEKYPTAKIYIVEPNVSNIKLDFKLI